MTAFEIVSVPENSLDVVWTDGPREADVTRFVRLFEGKRFDETGPKFVQHIFDGEDVSFGCDYVHVTRRLTIDFFERAKTQMAAFEHDQPAKFEEFLRSIHYQGDATRDIVYLQRMFARTIGEVEPLASVTATAILLANPFLHEG